MVIGDSSSLSLSVPSDNLLQAAKDYYSQQTVQNNSNIGTLSITTVKKKGYLLPNWSQAALQKLNDGSSVIVIQSPSVKLGSTSIVNVVRKFVFTLTGTTITQGRIIEIYDRTNYINSHKNNLLENFNNSNIPNDFNGAIITYDLSYNYISSKKYINGVPDNSSGARIGRIVQNAVANASKSTQSLNISDYWETCTDYYWITYINGFPVDYEYLYTVCDDSPDNNELGGDPSNCPCCTTNNVIDGKKVNCYDGNGGSGDTGNDMSIVAPSGSKPAAEFTNQCDGTNYMWNMSQPTTTDGPKETVGLLAADGQFFTIGTTYSEASATISGLVTVNGQTYYGYPPSAGPPTQTYQGMISNSAGYFIPIVATVHTHAPCIVDGTNGVHNFESRDDIVLANNYPNLRHYALGCDAMAEIKRYYDPNSPEVNYLNTW